MIEIENNKIYLNDGLQRVEISLKDLANVTNHFQSIIHTFNADLKFYKVNGKTLEAHGFMQGNTSQVVIRTSYFAEDLIRFLRIE